MSKEAQWTTAIIDGQEMPALKAWVGIPDCHECGHPFKSHYIPALGGCTAESSDGRCGCDYVSPPGWLDDDDKDKGDWRRLDRDGPPPEGATVEVVVRCLYRETAPGSRVFQEDSMGGEWLDETGISHWRVIE